MEGGIATADYVIVAGFFVVMLGIGLYFARRMTTLRDFFGGGSQVPWWVSGVSLYMTTFSAFAFVAYSALAYKNGMVAITIWWLVAVCCLISARFFAARWRRAVSTSPVEFIERRFGRTLRQGFAWSGVPLVVIDDALKLFVIGTMVTGSLGIDDPRALPWAILIGGGIMLTYTFLGGLWAVMITDFVQFVVMATAVVVLAPLVLLRVGGIGGFVRDLPPEMWTPTSEAYPLTWIIPFFFVMIFSYSVKWSIVQRYYSVRTDREARRVGYLVALLTFVGMPLVVLPAMAARIFLPDIADPNLVYSAVCRELLPVGMLGMVIAAMFSATMSMLSSDYNAVASVLTNDIFRRLFAPKASERTLVLVGRLTTLAIGLVAMGVALVLASAKDETDLVKIMAKLFSVLLPPVAIPMMFGLLTRKVSNAGGLGAFLAGTVFGLTAYFLSYQDGLEFLRTVPWLTWITALPTLAAMFLLSWLYPDSPEKQDEVVRFLDGLETTAPERDEPAADSGGENPTATALRIIGVAAAAMGALLVCSVVATAGFEGTWLSIAVGVFLLVGGTALALLSRSMGQTVNAAQ